MGFFSKKRTPSKNEDKGADEFKINDQLKVIFNSSGLVPVIIQNDKTGEVLRLGYLDRWALEMSLNEKHVFLFRRSLQRVEMLGEKDGVEYKIESIKLGQYYRSLLFKVNISKRDKVQTSFVHDIYPETNKK